MLKTPEIVIVPGRAAFGSALGEALVRNGLGVTFVFRDWMKALAYATALKIDRLPEINFSNKIKCTADMGIIRSADLIVLAVPTQFLPTYYEEQIKSLRREDTPVLSLAKGLVEIGDEYLRPSEAIIKLDPSVAEHIAVWSGPNFALEVALGKYFASVIASKDGCLAERLVSMLTPKSEESKYRIYASTDVIGIEFGGALKNVIAIAAGICDSLNFGDNARAALIARGQYEIASIAIARGGRMETFIGLTSQDLAMTSISKQSRNHQFGEGIGQGRNPRELLQEFQNKGKTVEGFETAKVAWMLAKRLKLKTPVIDAVYALLHEGANLENVIKGLKEREPIHENGKRFIPS